MVELTSHSSLKPNKPHSTASDHSAEKLPAVKRTDAQRSHQTTQKLPHATTQDASHAAETQKPKGIYRTASGAIDYQITHLKREIAGHLRKQSEHFNEKELAPVSKELKIATKQVHILQDAIAEQEKLKAGFSLINANQTINSNIETLQKQLAATEKKLEAIQKKASILFAKKAQFTEEHKAFIRYLDYGRELIKKEPIFKSYDHSTKIQIRPVKPGDMKGALVALSSVMSSVKTTIDTHDRKPFKASEKKTQIAKQYAAEVSKEQDTGLLAKFAAGFKDAVLGTGGSHQKVIENTERAQAMAKESRADYSKTLQLKINFSQKVKDFFEVIQEGQRTLKMSGTVAFHAVVASSAGNLGLSTAGALKKLRISFNDIIIAKKSGMSPALIALGKDTRRFEGTTNKASPHYEGNIVWPRYRSGITVGGYDFGYKTKAQATATLKSIDAVLKNFGKPPIPATIKNFLIASTDPRYRGEKADTFLKRAIKKYPEIGSYKFEPEACTVFFLKYFKPELLKARKHVNKHFGITSKEEEHTRGFSSFPLLVQKLITDTYVRGDNLAITIGKKDSEQTKALKRQRAARFWGAVKKGADQGDWSDLADIYIERSVFIYNPNINRHDQRAALAQKLKDQSMSDSPAIKKFLNGLYARI
jgi:hypothetical protein